MGKHHITKVVPEPGAVDSLLWTVEVRTDFFGINMERILLAAWSGAVAFYREPIPGNSMPAPDPRRRIALPAEWVNRDKTTKLLAPQDVSFVFRTQLPGDALARLERFRDGERLYARVEGQFMRWSLGDPNAAFDQVEAVLMAAREPRLILWADVRSEPHELTRDEWGAHVLATLRPPGIVPLEVKLPTVESEAEPVKRALAHLDEAQRALDENKTDRVAHMAYRALDELKHLADRVQANRGEFIGKRLLEERKALASICDPERHGERPSGPTGQVDRVLAQHILAAAKSLVAVFASDSKS